GGQGGAITFALALSARLAAEEGLPTTTATTTAGGRGRLRQLELRGIREVGDLDDQVADVIHAGERVLGQVRLRRDRDDAVVDRVTEADGAAADILKYRVQRLGELDVAQAGGDGG